MSANSSSNGGLFGNASFGASTGGIGTQLFGTPQTEPLGPEADTAEDETATNPPESDIDEDEHEGEGEDGDDSASEASEVIALAATPSVWRGDAIPAYTPPQYLSTDVEYIPAPAKPVSTAKTEDGGAKDSETEKWNAAMEGYENSMDLDHVFERFVKRVGYEGGQCIRYVPVFVVSE
jgi:pre-rRNA-processing protein TSR4